MKQLTWSLLLAVVAMACQMQDEPTSLNKNASSGTAVTCDTYPYTDPVTGSLVYYTPNKNYTNTASFPDGYTLNLSIDKVAGSKAKSISHLIFKFTDCDDKVIGLDRVTGVSVNGSTTNAAGDSYFAKLSNSTGGGESCFGAAASWGTFVKLDEGFDNFPVNLTITFSSTLSTGGAAAGIKSGAFLLKAGSFNSPGDDGGCFGAYYSVTGIKQGNGNNTNCKYTFTYAADDPAYSFSRDCTPPPTCYQEDSAWGSGTRYVTRGNWATYTTWAANSSVNIYAGQNKLAGSVSMSANIGGKVTLTITLNPGWSLQEVSNPVKIQGYSSQPASGNPSPGRFASKGSSLTVTVPAAAYYGIHLDVRQAVTCP